VNNIESLNCTEVQSYSAGPDMEEELRDLTYLSTGVCRQCYMANGVCDQSWPKCRMCSKLGAECVGYDPTAKREVPRR